MFVSHIGEIYPAGFCPWHVGDSRMRRSSRCIKITPFFGPYVILMPLKESAAHVRIGSFVVEAVPGHMP